MGKELNVYDLSRTWFNFCFANPEQVKPIHTALYFFAIEHCNRLGWKRKFGLPSSMAKEAIGIKSFNTYSKTLADLVEWGFIEMIEKAKNQYSSNIIALSKNVKAHGKALDKALIKHASKQELSTVQSTGESIDSINKQDTIIQEYHFTRIQDFEKLVYPFDEIFKNIFFEWMKYRQDIKKPYQTFSSIQAELQELGKHAFEKAKFLITLAMKNGWKNIIDDGSYEKKGQGKSDYNSRKTGVATLHERSSEILRQFGNNNPEGGNT